MSIIKSGVRMVLKSLGLEAQPKSPANALDQSRMPVELDAEEIELLKKVKGERLSMTSYPRLWSNLMACKYVVEHDIPGDFVECGVWRGGNALIAAAVFKRAGGLKDRKIYLFDTFEGMTAPTVQDRDAVTGEPAMDKYLRSQRATHNEWCYASLEDVEDNFKKLQLLTDRVVFVKGDVCKTLDLNENIPSTISVLRLDTDWYESTKRELEILYPRLAVGGVLILDDYGRWEGVRQAVDEYFSVHGNRPFFQYTDRAGRMAVKV